MGFLNHREVYDYFGGFRRYAKAACTASQALDSALRRFDPQDVSEHVQTLHKIENDADSLKHEMMGNLAHEFIAPIEREDIANLAQELDNVVDSIEEVMIRLYMYNVRTLRAETLEFSELLQKACEALSAVLEEFPNFKKTKTISGLIVEVNALESEGDKLYMEAVRTLFTDGADTASQLVWTVVFEALEACLDACEHAADIVEGVMMKNT